MYSLIFSIALFILIARNGEKIHPLLAAAIVVGAPALLAIIVAWINPLAPLPNLIVTAVQYLAACAVFAGIHRYADVNLTGFFTCVIVGWPVIFLLVPSLVSYLL